MPKTADIDAHEEPSDGAVSIESLAAIVQGIAQSVDNLSKQVQEVSARPAVVAPNVPQGIPRARSTSEILDGMRRGEARRGQDRVDPYGQSPAFNPDEVVALRDEEKLRIYREKGMVKGDEDLYGVVKSFMYRRRRDGLRKYKVDFGENFGEDGIMEDQLEYIGG
jgi:hypothetical protein